MNMDLSQKCPNDFNLTRYCIERQAKKYPTKTALLHITASGQEFNWSYQEVWETISRIANGLKLLHPEVHSRVMIRMTSSPDYAFIFFACMLVDLIPIPSYEGLTEQEALFLIEDSQSTFLIESKELQISKEIPQFCKRISLENLKESSPLRENAQTKAEDPALLVYTSGTTNKPKGVIRAHRSIWGRRPIRKCLLDISANDVVLHTDTLNFTYTYGVLFMDTWASGATAVLFQGKKTPEIWLKLITTYHVTLFATCPSTYVSILETCKNNPQKLPSLRHCISAGEAIKKETVEAWENWLGVPLYESLGMSEVSLFISSGPLIPRKKGSVGKPQESRKIGILVQQGNSTEPVANGTMGLLAVHRSEPGLMLGYWKRPKEEKEAFRGDWFLTGDLVHQNEEGYIFYHGRTGTILNIDSDVVSPQEVEALFENYPGIEEVGCWEVLDAQKNSVLALFVVEKTGTKIPPKILIKYAQSRLADYKCPKKIFFLKKLPRGPRGKLLRRKLPDLII